MGWRVVMPTLLRRVPEFDELGRSVARCGACGHSLAPAGLPALPWALAAGSCAPCGAARPRWCAAVEAATGVSFGLAAARAGWSAALLPVLSLFAGLVAMSAVDIWAMRIPTRFAHATALAVVVALVVAIVVDGDVDMLRGAAAGAAVLGGGLLVLHLISPRMLGFGDVRLATVAGLVVGWLAWTPDRPVLGPVEDALDAALLGGLIGALVGVVLLVARRRNAPFPFGPSLALGAAVVILASL
ncbi:MAG TPA: A24 family peptidase [Acidimicrobiales bacterium]|nr:A24 family peptidase [Acidimicrobiales bacterium]